MGAIEYGCYSPADSDEALELEARCIQGKKFQLRFARPYFHRRAENFHQWKILTARSRTRLIGVFAGAIKEVAWRGRPTKALFFFDARVDPEWRRSGVARTLANQLIDWAAPNAEIGYTYTIGDNAAVTTLGKQWIGAEASPGCAYLACPVYGNPTPSPDVRGADPAEVHASMKASSGPFDLYADPAPAFDSDAVVGSWIYARGSESAACSGWSNESILSEIIERVPAATRLAGEVLSRWPLNLRPWPHTPVAGERLRSWYLFDFHASGPEAAAELVNAVAAEARARGIDYCYVIHQQGAPWIPGLLRGFPKAFSPIVPFTILARTLAGAPVRVERPYTDIRDV
ncbi:MAG TPA: GNAT family N-acetyltransferase [Allosphingosinicella sp.]|nr:GNAT family N-acetyltransferase [Allosphingosinicella sp.]